MIFAGLRLRIAATVIVITMAATATMAFAAYTSQRRAITGRFVNTAQDSFISDLGQAIAVGAAAANSGPLGSNKLAAIGDYMNGRLKIIWAVIDTTYESSQPSPSNGTAVYPAGLATQGRLPLDVPAAWISAARRVPATQWWPPHQTGSPNTQVLITAGPLDPNQVLVEFYDPQPLWNQLNTLRIQLSEIAVVVASIAAAAGIAAAGRVQRPVRTAAAAAHELGTGRLDTRLPVRGRDELADLAASFNAMAERLATSIYELRVKDNQQRRFVADVAHDLRTPVAAMIAATDSLHHPDTAVRARAGHLLGTQSRRLAKLIDDLLEMSRFDAGAADFRPEPIDLRDLIADTIGFAKDTAEIDTHLTGDLNVTGDPRRLHTILRNLITNAVRHGAEPITVTADGTSPDTVQIRVADSGPGIAPEMAPMVFDRFTRGDPSRRTTEGSGLGLAIAAQNAKLHDATLTLREGPAPVFTLSLPRHAKPTAQAELSNAPH